jgi:hypothetical protein
MTDIEIAAIVCIGVILIAGLGFVIIMAVTKEEEQ